MGDVTELEGVMMHLREAVRDNDFSEWVLVGTTTDDMTYVGFSPSDVRAARCLLQDGGVILQDAEVPYEPEDDAS